MDDFIIVGSKKELREVKARIGDFLAERLHLQYNGKTDIAPCSHGIDFCGYRHWSTHVLPRRRTVLRATRTFRALSRKFRAGKFFLEDARAVIASFAVYAMHCDCKRSAESAFNELILCTGD